MNDTPNAMRLHLVLAGRVNSGKSTIFNLIAGQDLAVTSPVPGTTTDVVSKAMELRPIGPVLLLDSAGLGDAGELGEKREAKTTGAFDRADVLLLVLRQGTWGGPEAEALQMARERGTAVLPVVNLFPGETPDESFAEKVASLCGTGALFVDIRDGRDAFLSGLKVRLIELLPEDFVHPPPLVGDLVTAGDTVVMVVPVDIQAPKGRLILPQVQTLRDALDAGAIVLTCRDTELEHVFKVLKEPPKLVICDSQKVKQVNRLTPNGVFMTTFSVLFSRLKGDFDALLEGAKRLEELRDGDRILIAEGCTHHATDQDIGRVKIPRMLLEKTGKKLDFEVASGRDYPANLKDFALIVHCGGCMLNRREMLRRIALARQAQVPVTNYGMAISFCQDVLDRVIKPVV